MNKLVIISGPTSSGKTSTSISLATELKKLGISSAIVNFDSLLFYKELTIGTAKPTSEELEQVEHHLVNISSAKEPLNASDYIKLAEEKIIELFKQDKVVFLVGGSGFYLRALIKGMYESRTPNEQLQKDLDQLYKEQGIAPFLSYLKEHDPQSLINLHENDHYRLIRAVEHHKMTGEPISKEKERFDQQNPYDFSENTHPDWDIFHLYLDLPKNEHWEIIQKRTQKMFDDGLINEVKSLLDQDFTGFEKPLQSIGYKETVGFLRGEYSTISDCQERLNISTRQLAKSQRTFFKKVTPKEQYHPLQDKQKIHQDLLKFITQKN